LNATPLERRKFDPTDVFVRASSPFEYQIKIRSLKMAILNRYEPWTMNRDFVNEVSRLFERTASNDTSSSATADWVPPVDIEESGDKFVLYVDVPGVDLKSVDITLEKGVLSVAGSREKVPAKEGVELRRAERVAGRFFRRFSLPDTVDADAVSATGTNGVLEISIPKRAAVQPRRIEIRA